jgi:FkbM family methyltransferase
MPDLSYLIQSYLCTKPLLYRQLLLWKGKSNFYKAIYLSLVKSGDTIFDIGANVGYYSWHFSHIAGRTGEVYAFEPVPDTYTALDQAINQNYRLKNVRLINKAVGEKSEVREIHSPANHQQASLGTLTAGSWLDSPVMSYPVSVISIDDYVKENSVTKLDFIKLDTEGYELMTLKGAVQTLTKLSPILCLQLCSIWFEDCGYCAADLIPILEATGYQHFYLAQDEIYKLKNPHQQLGKDRFAGIAKLVCATSQKHSKRLNELDVLSRKIKR